MTKSIKSILEHVRRDDVYWEEWLVSEFTEELCRRMEVVGLSRTAFAQKIGSSPAYVTKVLRGEENLTVKTMAKLARAVRSIVRMHLAPAGTYTVWLDMSESIRWPIAEVSNASDVFGDPRDALPANGLSISDAATASQRT